MLQTISEILIFIFGVSAFWFTSGQTNNSRVIGGTLGLVGQIFWFVVTISASQWWIVLLCCFYTFNWCRLIWNNLGTADVKGRLKWFILTWRSALSYVWYFRILGRRRTIIKDEDCEFYVDKQKPGRCQPYECWGDGHFMCKTCLHYKPEPIDE